MEMGEKSKKADFTEEKHNAGRHAAKTMIPYQAFL